MRKQPVMDADENGIAVRRWLWYCDECGYKEINDDEEYPPDWGVYKGNYTICPDCRDPERSGT